MSTEQYVQIFELLLGQSKSPDKQHDLFLDWVKSQDVTLSHAEENRTFRAVKAAKKLTTNKTSKARKLREDERYSFYVKNKGNANCTSCGEDIGDAPVFLELLREGTAAGNPESERKSHAKCTPQYGAALKVDCRGTYANWLKKREKASPQCKAETLTSEAVATTAAHSSDLDALPDEEIAFPAFKNPFGECPF